MKHTRGATPAKRLLDRESHDFHVLGHLHHGMVGKVVARVPAVIALIVDDQVEVRKQLPPERKIGIACKSVAVSEDDARTATVSVTADVNHGAVRHGEVENGMRL